MSVSGSSMRGDDSDRQAGWPEVVPGGTNRPGSGRSTPHARHRSMRMRALAFGSLGQSAQFGSAADDLADQPVFRGGLRGHPVIALGVLGHAFDRLPGFAREDLVQPLAHADDLAGVDLD